MSYIQFSLKIEPRQGLSMNDFLAELFEEQKEWGKQRQVEKEEKPGFHINL